MTRSENDHLPHAVYRCYDQDDRLLYVGCTVRLATRLDEHRYGTWWAWRIAQVTSEVFPDAFTAREAESAAIRSEDPRFNIHGRWRLHCGWSADQYIDYYRAVAFGKSGYTGQSQKRLVRVKRLCLDRYGVDPSEIGADAA